MGQDVLIPGKILQGCEQVRIPEGRAFDYFRQAIVEIPAVRSRTGSISTPLGW